MAEQLPPDALANGPLRGDTPRRRGRRNRRKASPSGQMARSTGESPEGPDRPPASNAGGAQSASDPNASGRRRRGGKRRGRKEAAKEREARHVARMAEAQAARAARPAGAKPAAKSRPQAAKPQPSRPTPPVGVPPRLPPLPAGAGQGLQQHSFAAIDLGTNNCRLLIARPSGDSFVVVDAFSRVVRLGEGLAQTGRLSDAAMERALGALRICGEKLRRRGVTLARSVATEACRRASNGPEFIERVRRETGIWLDIISAREEARLAVLGCHILLEPGPGPALVFDIGGGSTELVLIDHDEPGGAPRILDFVSIPYGVVSLTESCQPERDSVEARADRYAEMRGRVADGFAEFAGRLAPLRQRLIDDHGALRLLGTSGTITTLASVHLDLPHYDRSMVDGCIVPTHRMRDICQMLATRSLYGRREVACIGRERADLVVAGCAILESILDLWPAARLGVADRGIREGILRSLIGITPSLGGHA
ncbi:Ppx/GppA phosphatase family protein [Novosphingobium umbonatum]|nr:Ppx/GppA phosphatase family protein [Novosphingobium umbonatum]